MESFVAGIFSDGDRALAAYAALSQLPQSDFQLESAAVYARNLEGDLARKTAVIGNAEDLAFADSGAGQEALDELDAEAPEGDHVLLLHVVDAGPSSIDEMLRSYGGTVVRRSVGDLESSSARRFDDL